MRSASRLSRAPDRLPDIFRELQVLEILREVIQTAKQRKRILQSGQRGPAEAGGCANPCLLTELHHHAVGGLLDGHGDSRLAAGHCAGARGDLHDHAFLCAHRLRLQICAVEFRYKSLRHVYGGERTMKKASVHNSIIILSVMVSEVFTKKTRASFTSLFFASIALLIAALLFAFPHPTQAQAISCAAVPQAGTPFITVNADQDHVNVRSGPNSYLYDKVGILYPGESAPALGRTPGGDWIQVACPGAPNGTGWVYSANVTLTSTGFLTVVPPPPTPPFTLNLDPTLAASLEVQPTATRLATYTPPPPQATLPAYGELPNSSPSSWTAPLIAGLAIAGVIGLLFSFIFRR